MLVYVLMSMHVEDYVSAYALPVCVHMVMLCEYMECMCLNVCVYGSIYEPI